MREMPSTASAMTAASALNGDRDAVVSHDAHPPRPFSSDGGAIAVGASRPGSAPARTGASSGTGEGTAATAQSGQASRTRLVASAALLRAASHRAPGSIEQILSAARRIDPSARQAALQSVVDSAADSSLSCFSRVRTSSRPSCGAVLVVAPPSAAWATWADESTMSTSALAMVTANGNLRDDRWRGLRRAPAEHDAEEILT